MTELYQTLGEEAATKPLFLGCSVRCPQPQKGPLCAFPPKGPNPGRVLRAARPVLGAAAASCPADKGVQLRFSSRPVTAADLNNIKFSAYRTAMKLRRVQKALRCECGKHGPPGPSRWGSPGRGIKRAQPFISTSEAGAHRGSAEPVAEKQQIHCLWVRVELLQGRCESKPSETKGTKQSYKPQEQAGGDRERLEEL